MRWTKVVLPEPAMPTQTIATGGEEAVGGGRVEEEAILKIVNWGNRLFV